MHQMRLFVQTHCSLKKLDNKKWVFEGNFSTFGDLMQMIEDEMKIPVETQSLTFGGKMRHAATLMVKSPEGAGSVTVPTDSTIHLTVDTRRSPRRVDPTPIQITHGGR